MNKLNFHIVSYINNKNILFFIFLFLYLVCGFYLTFNTNTIINKIDVLFGTDTGRVARELGLVYHYHYGLTAHPLYVSFAQFIKAILNVITHSEKASIVILMALAGAFSVELINSILKLITEQEKLSLLFACIYGFSFSTIIFSSIPETYIFSAFINLITIYYILNFTKKNLTITIKEILVLSLLGTINIGIQLGNIIFYILYLSFLCTYIYKNNLKQKILIGIKFTICTCVIFGISFFIQWYGYIDKNELQNYISLKRAKIETQIQQPSANLSKKKSIFSSINLIDINLDKQKIIAGVTGSVINALCTDNIEYKNISVLHGNIDRITVTPFILLLLLSLFYGTKNLYHKETNKYILPFLVLFLISILIFVIYCWNETFLFSQLSLIFFIILCASIQNMKSPITYICLSIILLIEVIYNIKTINNIIHHFYTFEWGG